MLHRHHSKEELGHRSIRKPRFNFSLNCQGVDSNHRWEDGPEFYRQLLNTKLTIKRMKGEQMRIFKNDGSVRETELKIVNFRPVGTNKNDEAEILNKQWEEVMQL